MLEWRRLAANRIRSAEWLPAYPTPLLWCTLPPAEAVTNLLGEQRHMCVNNLPRVAPSGGTAGNRTTTSRSRIRRPSGPTATPPSHTGMQFYSVAPYPTAELCPWPCWRTSVPKTSCVHPISNDMLQTFKK